MARFRVTEDANGKPCIVVERSGGDDLCLFENMVGFDLRPGTSIGEAEAISHYLNSKLIAISETELNANRASPES
jgi:hypothetical protein